MALSHGPCMVPRPRWTNRIGHRRPVERCQSKQARPGGGRRRCTGTRSGWRWRPDRRVARTVQPRAAAPELGLPNPGRTVLDMRGRPTTRKEALLNVGALSPNPRGLALWDQNGWTTMKALERRIGQRRGATRAPAQAPEWRGQLGPPQTKSDPPVHNFLDAKNGVDKGGHFRPPQPTSL